MVEHILDSFDEFQSLLDRSLITFDQTLYADLRQCMSSKPLQMAVAETVTGGLLTTTLSMLTEASASSVDSICCPVITTRLRILGIAPETVRVHGPESREVASEMVQSLYRMFRSPCCIALTGTYAPKAALGASASELNLAMMIAGQLRMKSFKLAGNRISFHKSSVITALEYIRNYLIHMEM